MSGLVRHVVEISMEAVRLRKYSLVVSICTVHDMHWHGIMIFVVFVVYYALHTHSG